MILFAKVLHLSEGIGWFRFDIGLIFGNDPVVDLVLADFFVVEEILLNTHHLILHLDHLLLH
jgi:hypothetical protein